jgi:hypothetical protein
MYPDNTYGASKEELAEVRKLKRALRTLKTTEAKERTSAKLKHLEEVIRSRRPTIATAADIETILSQGRESVRVDIQINREQSTEQAT